MNLFSYPLTQTTCNLFAPYNTWSIQRISLKLGLKKTLNSAGLWTVKQHPLFACLGPLYKGDSDSDYNPRQKSLRQYSNIHIFLSFVGSLLKQCILFEIFLQFSLSPPYTKLKLGKNFGYMRPTLFVGWGERGWTCVNWKMPRKGKSVPRLLSMIVVYLGVKRNNQVIIATQFFLKISTPLKSNILCHYSNTKIFCYCIVPHPKWALFQIEKFCLSFSIIPLQPSLTWKLYIGNNQRLGKCRRVSGFWLKSNHSRFSAGLLGMFHVIEGQSLHD